MSTSTAGFKHVTLAACAAVITAVSAWAFVSSGASIGRDPFQFAAVMAANAQARTAQYQARNVMPACPGEFVASNDAIASPATTCRKA